jgi:hypothetical protein
MRIATFVVVLVVHAFFVLLFLTLRKPALLTVDDGIASTAFFVEPAPPVEPERAESTVQAHQADPRRPTPPARSSNAPQPQSTAISPPPPAARDWRNELEIAANNQLAREDPAHQQPSPLAPHDFSAVKPGSTDESKHEFGWDYAATHRVEELPTGGLLFNINDRCVIVWAILPLVGCRIGKITARGDLFNHLKDAPEPRP